MYTVYEHINKINGKKYFGITSKKPEERWGHNGRCYTKSYFGNAIKKYGWNNFEHIIILRNVTKEEACYAEIYLIKWYDTTNPENGYNISFGGDVNNNNPEIGKKISQSKMGHEVSEETRQKLSEIFKGKPNEKNKGRVVTEETRELLRTINTGKTHPESKEKHREASLKMWEDRRNNPEAMEEFRKTQANNSKKKVREVATGKIFDSAKEASQYYGKCDNYVTAQIYRKTGNWEFV